MMEPPILKLFSQSSKFSNKLMELKSIFPLVDGIITVMQNFIVRPSIFMVTASNARPLTMTINVSLKLIIKILITSQTLFMKPTLLNNHTNQLSNYRLS